ncbi:MAG: hypothetical protein ABSA76_03785 [Bacteroidales bacterium]
MTHNESYKNVINKFGYPRYQWGLITHHSEQGKGWDSHLANCRQFILKAVDFYKPDKVTVFGSGWLLDLPLAELLDRNIKVSLNDIIHPPEVIKQVSGLKDVELIERDATGGLVEEVYEKCRKISPFRKLQSLSDIIIPELTLDEDPGLVVSLNLISQLDVLPIKYLRKRARVPEEQFEKFRIAVQQKHIDFLLKHPSVMITDTVEVYTNKGKSDNPDDFQWVVADLPEGKYKEEWTWDFDLYKSGSHEKRSVLKVIALIL